MLLEEMDLWQTLLQAVKHVNIPLFNTIIINLAVQFHQTNKSVTLDKLA